MLSAIGHLVPAEFSDKFGSLIKAVLGGFDWLRLCGPIRLGLQNGSLEL
jgi:hypothetical protein